MNLELFTETSLKKLLFESEFFSSTAECSPSKRKKIFSKKDASYLKIAIDRRKTLKKEKEKRKLRKRQTTTNIFLLLLFYTALYRKINILLENIFQKN